MTAPAVDDRLAAETRRNRRLAARHEAAHAVAALRTGTHFEDVLLDPPVGPALGLLTLPDPPSGHALAVVLCAGLIADLQSGYPIDGPAGCDLDELMRLGPELSACAVDRRTALLAAFEEARQILRRQHAAIDRVTAALLERGRLSYDDVRRIAQLPGTVPGTAQMAIAAGRR